MSVLITPKVFLYNAFLSKKQPYLTYKELAKFANILEDMILERSKEKYVIFKLEEIEIDNFLDKDNNFMKGIRKIHCKDLPSKKEIDEINSIYSIDVQKAFKLARVLN